MLRTAVERLSHAASLVLPQLEASGGVQRKVVVELRSSGTSRRFTCAIAGAAGSLVLDMAMPASATDRWERRRRFWRAARLLFFALFFCSCEENKKQENNTKRLLASSVACLGLGAGCGWWHMHEYIYNEPPPPDSAPSQHCQAKVVPNAEHGGRNRKQKERFKNGGCGWGCGRARGSDRRGAAVRARAVKCCANYQLNSDSRLIGRRLMHAVQTTAHYERDELVSGLGVSGLCVPARCQLRPGPGSSRRLQPPGASSPQLCNISRRRPTYGITYGLMAYGKEIGDGCE